MNIIVAKATVLSKTIIYTYYENNKPYHLEIPRTEYNAYIEDGKSYHMVIGVGAML